MSLRQAIYSFGWFELVVNTFCNEGRFDEVLGRLTFIQKRILTKTVNNKTDGLIIGN